MNDIMIISPHPDDAEISMGGTIAKMIKQGLSLIIIDLTNGEPTPYGDPKTRAKETEISSKILGIKKRVNLNLPNRMLEDNIKSKVLLANQIRKFKPTVLFVPHSDDIHPDHSKTFCISQAARFYAKFHKAGYMGIKFKPCYPKKIYFYYSFHQLKQIKVSFVVDISKFFDKKLQAIQAYKSQFVLNKKNKKIFNLIRIHSEYYGSLIGCKYAEPFYSDTVLQMQDCKNLLK